MSDTVEEKSIRRFRFLKKVYDDTGGDSMELVAVGDIGNSLGYEENETIKIYRYLRDEGLIGGPAIDMLNITHAGIVEIEKAEQAPQIPTEHFPANIINIHGNVTGAALQVGNTNSTQTANINISAQDIQGLVTWLNKLKEGIPSLGLTDGNRQAITRNIATLENETHETEPDKSILKTAIGRVKSLLETVAGHMIAVELLNQLPAITHYLRLQ